MFDVFVRFLKRVALFVPGIVITGIVIATLYPSLDNKLPAGIAILVVYILVAYIVIPLAVRAFRFVVPPKHIPVYSTTPDGFASDPVNIGILGSREQLEHAFNKTGWHKADKRTLKSIFKYIRSILLKTPYPNAPFSNLYLLGRGQDLGFQLQTDDHTAYRHHVRFWECAPKLSSTEKLQLEFWKRHRPEYKTPPTLWLGAASLDSGVGVIRHNFQLTHMVHPDTNKERALIVRQLTQAGCVASTEQITINNPYRLRNRVINASFHADGKLAMIELK